MKSVTVMIIRTAGTNCDQETQLAFTAAGARVTVRHVNELRRQSAAFSDCQIIALPGGFTYGDDIAAGRILANELSYYLREPLQRFVDAGGLMIGICNGFQVLVKMGLLPGNNRWQQEATLTDNDSGRFEARWVTLRRGGDAAHDICVWTRGLPERITLPVAHGEGKFVPLAPAAADELLAAGQIVLQYCDAAGTIAGYPDNPNGSIAHAAGICDPSGRIFGLMPHPERFVRRTQHPRWTRLPPTVPVDGLTIFKNAVAAARRS